MMEYGKREEAILSGIIELICSGMDVYSMKVSDIAKAAGMGKGTVYEYFSSKEEMITKAIIFGVWKSLEAVKESVAKCSSFEEKYRTLLGEVSLLMQNGLPAVKMLFSGADIEKTYEQLKRSHDYRQNIAMMETIVKDILAAGVSEGAIGAIADEYYARMAVISGVMGYCVIVQNAAEEPDGNAEAASIRAQDCSYRLVMNALNA